MQGPSSSLKQPSFFIVNAKGLDPIDIRSLSIRLALSLILHLLILLFPGGNHQHLPRISLETPTLRVQLGVAAKPTQKHTTLAAPIQRPKSKINPVSPTVKQSPHEKLDKIIPAAPETHPSAAEIVNKAYMDLPDTLEKLDTEAPDSKTALVFDPILREKLRKARTLETQLDAIRKKFPKDANFTILSRDSDSVPARVNNQCLQIPIPRGYDPFDARIIKWHRCPDVNK